jgi:DNA-binding SARP family transcriptional activator
LPGVGKGTIKCMTRCPHESSDTTFTPHIERSANIEASILGPLLLRVDGHDVVLHERLRVLLLRLLVDAGEPVSSDQLVDALWPKQPPASASQSLAVHVGRLRRLLEPGRAAPAPWSVLVTEPGGYRLDASRVLADFTQFEDDVAAARVASNGEGAEPAVELLEAALERWRGATIAGPAPPAFVAPLAARLSAARLDALELLAQLQVQLQRPDRALVHLQQLLAADPLRERAMALHGAAMHALGHVDDARRVLEQAGRQLDEAIGVEPGPALRRAMEQPLAAVPPPANEPAGSTEPAPLSTPAHDVVSRLLATSSSDGHEVARLLAAAHEQGIAEVDVLDELEQRIAATTLRRSIDADGVVRVHVQNPSGGGE